MLLCCRSFAATAREGLHIGREDSIRYRYTPATVDATYYDAVSSYAAGTKRNFIQRVIDYFEESARDRTFEKKIDITFIGGPSYSSDKSLCLSVLAAGLYRVDRSDPTTPPSNVSLYGTVSINGYYYVGITGNTFFSRGKHRLDYDLGLYSQPTKFWGLGYDDAVNNGAVKYTAKKYKVSAKYMYAIMKHTYIGVTADFNYTGAKHLKNIQYIHGQKLHYTGAAAGTFIEYDSRDVVTYPTKGIYLSARCSVQPKAAGDCGYTIWRGSVTADFYQRVWKGGVIAADLYGEFNSAHTPWTMYATLGGSNRMRGYYEGRFNDLDMVTAQIELRQRIWRRIGCTVWGGAGNVFRSLDSFHWKQTLPNYGIGFRWELKKNINVRFDYGFGCRVNGKLINGFVLSMNEAF